VSSHRSFLHAHSAHTRIVSSHSFDFRKSVNCIKSLLKKSINQSENQSIVSSINRLSRLQRTRSASFIVTMSRFPEYPSRQHPTDTSCTKNRNCKYRCHKVTIFFVFAFILAVLKGVDTLEDLNFISWCIFIAGIPPREWQAKFIRFVLEPMISGKYQKKSMLKYQLPEKN